MKKKKLLVPALILSIILILFCTAFYFSYRQMLSVDEINSQLIAERDRNEALEKERMELESELERINNEYEAVLKELEIKKKQLAGNRTAERVPAKSEAGKEPQSDLNAGGGGGTAGDHQGTERQGL